MLIYGIQSGQVQVPTQALWRPEVANSPYANPDLRRGIFSPFWLSTPARYPSDGAFMDLIAQGAGGLPNNAAGPATAFRGPGSAAIGTYRPPGAVAL